MNFFQCSVTDVAAAYSMVVAGPTPTDAKETMGQMMTKCFEPFHWSVWLIILIFLTVSG